MEFVRPIDWDHAQASMFGGYKGQYLYSGESCVIIATKVPAGSRGPGRHVHASDQTYFIIDGSINISLGDTEHAVRSGSAIFIPAGLPHYNWNSGGADEVHLEIIAPGIRAGLPIAESNEDPVPAGLAGQVIASDPSKRGGDEFTQEHLVTREKGARHSTVYLAEVPPRKGGPPLHVHEFDQFYFVLSGQLSLQIGLSSFTAGPKTLVVLPAQVPHRQWNDTDTTETHLTIICPEPVSNERPWDTAVAFATTGEHIE